MLGPDGERLAKRHGAVTLADRAALGQTAADVRDELAASLGLRAAARRSRPPSWSSASPSAADRGG